MSAAGRGSAPGDLGPPRSRVPVLPGTTHLLVIDRVDWLAPVAEFLDPPMPRTN